jgi:YegS/Rv2252/BmrU family lipid kinase
VDFEAEQAVVIANPTAAGGWVGRNWESIERQLRQELGDVAIHQTTAAGHARDLAHRAVWAGKQVVLSLGGDGTHSEVVRGIVRSRPHPDAVTLGILPAGTGGDFRRMVEGPRDLAHHIAQLRTAEPVAIDVGVLVAQREHGRHEQLFLNECSFGVSGEVCRRVAEGSKRLGALTYLLSTLMVLRTHRRPIVRLQLDGQVLGDFSIVSVMISNGRFAGGGMWFAPEANMADGMLDITVVEQGRIDQMAAFTPRIYRGTAGELPMVHTFRGFHFEAELITPGDDMVEADGDFVGNLPLDATVLPGAIKVIGIRPDVV